MRSTFVYEALDDATRSYLSAARRREGRGMPGIFILGSNPWPVIGLFVGPVLALVTFGWSVGSNQILNDPTGLALVQTAGLVLGGWMVVAAFRSWAADKSGSSAGHWTYADPLHLYEAEGERVTTTPMATVAEATAVHNLNNGTYTNSAVRLTFAAGPPLKLTLANQSRVETLVTFLNYLAWARGPEGGARANLPPAVLGGVAKYVAHKDNEPVDPEGNLDFNLLKLDDVEVPESPQKAGSARPRFLGYVFTVAAAVVCFFVMKQANVPLRDDALFKVVTENPTAPNLRIYLVDPRNERHRDEVVKLLAEHYTRPINAVRVSATDANLRRGMVKLLEGLKTADAPVVSVRVTEAKSPEGKGDGAADRAAKVRDRFGEKAAMTLGADVVAFVEAPAEANPHVDIVYEFVPAGPPNLYKLQAKVTIRESIEDAADKAFTATVTNPTQVFGSSVDAAPEAFTDALVLAMIGRPAGGELAAPEFKPD